MAYRYRRRDPETGKMELYEDAGRSIPVDFGGMNLTGTPNLDYLQNLANLAQQQQGPQLGPDEFGSYSIPVSDPTYRSGFDYARSIAGGMPMSQVIAPGVSYSPKQPMGYTQEQLNIPKDVDIPPPPPRFIDRETDRDRFSINRLPGDLPDFAKLGIDFAPGPEGAKPGILGNIDFANLPQKGFFSFDPENFKMLQNMGGAFDFDKDAIEKIVQERIAESMPTENIPSFIPEVPTGRDFSIDRENLDRPMISGLENRDLMDVDSLITGVPTGRDFSIDREPIPPQDFGYGPGIMPPLPPMDIRDIPPMDIRDIPPKINDQIFIDDRPIIDERIVDRGYGPGIMPPLPPMDIDKLIPPVDLPPINITDLPPINIMDLPPVDLPPINIPPRIPLDLPIVRPPTIMDKPRTIDRQTIMDELTGGRFSINQKRPMGLF